MSTNDDVNTEHDKQISSENMVSSDFIIPVSVDDKITEDIVSIPIGEDDEQKHAIDKEEITSIDIVPEVSVCFIQ